MRPVSEIIIHCSATRPEWLAARPTAEKVAEIRRWHIDDRGWKDIGYHYLIDRNGTVATGRPVEQVGAHVAGHNTGTIGVCLIGGHGSSETDRFEWHFTAAQDKALRVLLADLKRQHKGIVKISGHNQYAAKACPGFYVPTWYLKAAEPVQKPVPIVAKRDWLATLIAAIARLFGKK
jgi:N-acetylmuramoyl-L-alanine amidase